MIRKRQCCVLLLAAYAFIMLAGRGHAQNTGYYEEPAYGFSQAVRLYENNKFNAAKRAFNAVQRGLEEDDEYMRSETMYYKAM